MLHDRSITRTRCSPFEELTEYASQEKIQRQEIETLAQEEGQQVLGQEAEPQVVVARGQIRPDKRNEIDRRGLMDAHAQQEIRDYARTIGEKIVQPLFPLVWEAFVDYSLDAMDSSGKL